MVDIDWVSVTIGTSVSSAAIKECHRLGALNSRNLFSYNSGNWKLEMKLPAGLVSAPRPPACPSGAWLVQANLKQSLQGRPLQLQLTATIWGYEPSPARSAEPSGKARKYVKALLRPNEWYLWARSTPLAVR